MVKAIASTQSLSAFVKSICDIMRRSNCASALQYVPELTWILFLRILDAQEAREQEAAEAVGKPYRPALRAPFRWHDWAAPEGKKRKALKTKVGDLLAFNNWAMPRFRPHSCGIGVSRTTTPANDSLPLPDCWLSVALPRGSRTSRGLWISPRAVPKRGRRWRLTWLLSRA